MTKPILIKKSTGLLEPYDPEKLCQSIIKSGVDGTEAYSVCSVVSDMVTPGMESSHIWRTTLSQLYSHNITAAARYGLRHAMNQIGPDGFIFEKYLATLFAQEGYSTTTNIKVYGKSKLYHELDVQMERDGILHLIEAKYRNDYGGQTHLDTIMYAHARLLDISAAQPDRAIRMWVVTNSEFTTSAIQYAECYGITLLGWDYPQSENLQDIITRHNMYPISCIPDLTPTERRSFVEAGVLLLVDLIPYTHQDLVRRFSMTDDRAKGILESLKVLGL